MKADSVDYLMLTVVGGKESIEKRRVGGERIITKGVGVWEGQEEEGER